MRLRPEHKNHVWAYDFVLDRTLDETAFRMQTLIFEPGSPWGETVKQSVEDRLQVERIQ
jgi:hypothetical protein